jgi:hypothetical protein
MNTLEMTQHIARHSHAQMGGYPMFAIAEDGAALCSDCVRHNYRVIRESQKKNNRDGWAIVGIDINWEDNALYCDHCSKQIDCAYPD